MFWKGLAVCLLCVTCFCSCSPVDSAIQSYTKDEGLGITGYIFRNRDKGLKIKIGEISKEMLASEAERNIRNGVRPENAWFERDLEDSGSVFGISLTKEF